MRCSDYTRSLAAGYAIGTIAGQQQSTHLKRVVCYKACHQYMPQSESRTTEFRTELHAYHLLEVILLWRRLRLQITDASPKRTLVASGHERLAHSQELCQRYHEPDPAAIHMMDFQVPPCHLIELMASSVLPSSHLVECSHARGLGSLSHLLAGSEKQTAWP